MSNLSKKQILKTAAISVLHVDSFKTTKCLIVPIVLATTCFSAFSVESSPTPTPPTGVQPGVVLSSPSAVPNLLVPSSISAAGYAAQGTPSTKVPDAVQTQDATAPVPDLTWLLPPELHPKPLFYRAPGPQVVLMVTVPNSSEARMLLPGRASDASERARTDISRFFSEVIGSAASSRGRQLNAIESWVELTASQATTLGPDPWKRYQFSIEARKEALEFKALIAAQAPAELGQVVSAVSESMARIRDMMESLPTYETKVSWYNIMIQLKEGATLYQTQVLAADAVILAAADLFLAQNPPAPRPAGLPPIRKALANAPEIAAVAPNTAVSLQTPERTPAKSMDATSGNSLMSYGLGLLMLLGVSGIFLRIKNKIKPKQKAV